METNGLPGGIFSGMGPGMLGLEMPLHQSQQQQQQNPPNPHLHHPSHHPQLGGFGHHDGDHHPQSVKHGYPYSAKAEQQQLALSDEDEPGFGPDDGTGDGKRKMSPWQRMKWTDSMVRLLIMEVYNIGDEGGSEGNDPGKKKSGGLLQKKGKWKSVSRAMMERGYYVSPQQCEDKFNDLNKRYKRVNDILGRGTSCKVVENQSLLDTMDHLSTKMKEEVRKLLNSKHLFFREMCAYHNSCGGGGSGVVGALHSPEVSVEPSQHVQQHMQQRCLHSSETALRGTSLGRAETEGSKMVKGGSEEEEDDYEDEDDDEDGDDDEDEVVDGRARNEHGHEEEEEEEDDNEERHSRKRPRKELFSPSPLSQQLSCELTSMLQDGTRSAWEKRQWMKTQLIQLEERQVSCHCEAFELEKQRLKWMKYCGKKEREMELLKLKNERMKLENERMLLLLRRKELELADLQQQHSSNKRIDPTSIAG